ncbi:hypothetical protein CGC48_00855 [Capnocytophaga cynodegmi]|uniref:Uncharacterized protein n=1 Tax=Capnocytophaga cynodegmi TaxID=28189 RepID=A0A286NTF5_9FLAO|nr:hypothetical protein [Capnocytophaga cynodegmi]ATA67294.1 hypothetical protein CGC48_00855 [Capnocytophaga cynodegmi]
MEGDFFKKVDEIRSKTIEEEVKKEREILSAENYADYIFFNEVVIPVFQETFENYKIVKQERGVLEIGTTRFFGEYGEYDIEYILKFERDKTIVLENYTAGKCISRNVPFDFEFYRNHRENSKEYFKDYLEGLFIELAKRGY